MDIHTVVNSYNEHYTVINKNGLQVSVTTKMHLDGI